MNLEKWNKIAKSQSNYNVSWDIIFVRPFSRILLYFAVEYRALSPNTSTTISNIFLLASTIILLFFYNQYYWVAIIFLLLSQVFDHMDGAIARYRGTSSKFGSFYDKISDAVGFLLLFMVIGYVSFEQYGSILYLILAGIGAYCKLSMGYSKFLTITLEDKNDKKEIKKETANIIKQKDEILVNYKFIAKKLWNVIYRFYTFDEADLYFWVSLFIIIDRLDILCWILCISQAAAMLSMFIRRGIKLYNTDKISIKKHDY